MKKVETSVSPDTGNLLNNASNIIAIISHEFKTPLTAISAAVDLMTVKLQTSGQMEPLYEKNLQRITTEVFQLNKMLDEMLTINNIMSGKMPSHKQPTDVLQMLEELRTHYFESPEDARTFELQVSGTPQFIYADASQLYRVFMNLIGNALKFSREKAPLVALDFQEQQLHIRIIDDGIGIPEADLPHLFTPFFRASNVSEITGTGLGLSIVKTSHLYFYIIPLPYRKSL